MAGLTSPLFRYVLPATTWDDVGDHADVTTCPDPGRCGTTMHGAIGRRQSTAASEAYLPRCVSMGDPDP